MKSSTAHFPLPTSLRHLLFTLLIAGVAVSLFGADAAIPAAANPASAAAAANPASAAAPASLEATIPPLAPSATAGEGPLSSDQEKGVVGKSTHLCVNYTNIPAIEYVRFLSRVTGTNFIFNASELDFRITIVSEEFVSVESLMSILLQVLRVHGLSLAEENGQILIYKDASISKLATVVNDGEEGDGNLPPITTRVFHIENESPDEIKKIIEPLLSKEAAIQAASATGHLIVTDLTANIQKIEQLIAAIDKMEVAYYEVKYSYADSLVTLAQKILAPIGGKEVTLVAQPSTETVYVVATPFMIRRALGILQMLDVPGQSHGKGGEGSGSGAALGHAVPTTTTTGGRAVKEAMGEASSSTTGPLVAIPAPKVLAKSDSETTTFSIYKLQYHQGDEIRDALREVANSLRVADGDNSALVKTIGTIQWVRTTNSLVISGTKASIKRVSALIEELDIPLREVFIELLVVRTTLTNSLSVGVEWGAKSTFDSGGANPNVVQSGFGLTGPPPSALNAELNPLDIPSPITLPESLGGGVVGRFVSFKGKLFTSLGLLVNALQTCANTTVLLNPKVLTLDNNEAKIFVGSNIAFQGSTITQPGSQTTVGEIIYKDIGTTLIVKPLLSNGDMVTIDLTQEISQNASSTSTQSAATVDPTTKSNIRTRVSVPDGYFLVISGQINEDRISNHRGLPCLGGLPIIGACFSVKALSDVRDNLIIFMRPHILRTKADMVELTECEKLRYDKHEQPGTYQADLNTLLDVLNISPDFGKCCPNPLRCNCGYPCDDFVPNANRPCTHGCDDFIDSYFTYPCEPDRPCDALSRECAPAA